MSYQATFRKKYCYAVYIIVSDLLTELSKQVTYMLLAVESSIDVNEKGQHLSSTCVCFSYINSVQYIVFKFLSHVCKNKTVQVRLCVCF